MKLRARLGYLFVTPDAPLTTSKGGIIYPSAAGKHYPKTGYCHLHVTTNSWYEQGEDDLTNKKIIFDRWAGRPFKLKWSDGKEYEFICVSQWAVLAVIEETSDDSLRKDAEIEEEGGGLLPKMREGS